MATANEHRKSHPFLYLPMKYSEDFTSQKIILHIPKIERIPKHVSRVLREFHNQGCLQGYHGVWQPGRLTVDDGSKQNRDIEIDRSKCPHSEIYLEMEVLGYKLADVARVVDKHSSAELKEGARNILKAAQKGRFCDTGVGSDWFGEYDAPGNYFNFFADVRNGEKYGWYMCVSWTILD